MTIWLNNSYIIKTPTNGVKLDMLNYICVNQILDQN